MGARLKLFLPLVLFLALAGLLYSGLGRDPRELPSALVDRPLPPLRLAALDQGRVVDAAELRGQAWLLNVWGTWCGACRDEHPHLLELAKQGVTIVGLDYKDDPGRARDWLQRLGNPYRAVLIDADGRFGLELGVYGAPETYLIDPQGMVRYRHVGVLDAGVWRERIEPLYRRWAQP